MQQLQFPQVSTASSVNSLTGIKRDAYEKLTTQRSNYYRYKLIRPYQCVLAKNQPGVRVWRWSPQVEADVSLEVKAKLHE